MSENIMGMYAQFKTDPEMEKSGIELEYRTGAKKPTIIRIARAGGGNSKYQRVLDIKGKPYRRQIQTETIAPEMLEALMREVYADAVVLGWEDMTGPDGEIIPFTRENVIKVFTDLPDLFADVQASANKVALFRKQILEDDAKNS